MGIRSSIGRVLSGWLTKEMSDGSPALCDFERLSYEIRPCDVLLVEGRSRVSDVIKIITQSVWSHSALYIGRLHDVDDAKLRQYLLNNYDVRPDDQLLIEAVLGKGTIVSSLREYDSEHCRICRPKGIQRDDAQRVIRFAIDSLGTNYDVRQLLDLARFMFPYSLVPRNWRSSLFEHNTGIPTHTVCSTMIASAFMSVNFPILPVMQKDEDGKTRLYQRNPRRFTPRDFDYSPYFDIIKYPYVTVDGRSLYRELPWNTEGMVCNDENDCYIPQPVHAEPVIDEKSSADLDDDSLTEAKS